MRRLGGPTRSELALQSARQKRPDLAQCIRLATGHSEQLELFGAQPAAADAQKLGAAPLDHHRVDGVLPAPRAADDACPICGACLGSADAAHSLTGDPLADHLLDYHEGEMGDRPAAHRRRVERARAKAQELRGRARR